MVETDLSYQGRPILSRHVPRKQVLSRQTSLIETPSINQGTPSSDYSNDLWDQANMVWHSKGLFSFCPNLTAVTESNVVRESLSDSLADIEPTALRDRLDAILAHQPLTPGVLTLRTARALDSTVTTAAGARRGAGVQMSYEGLRLTRSIIRDRAASDDGDSAAISDELRNGAVPAVRTDGDGDEKTSYYLDLLAAEVLVSRGFYHLSTTGVASQAVEIVRRFGRNQTTELETGDARDPSLEVDVIKLAVDAGADLANVPATPALSQFRDGLAAELEAEPLPDPDGALESIETRVRTAVQGSELPEVDRR